MPIKKLLPDSAHDGLFSSKPKSNSVYLSVVVFNHEQQVLLSPNQQLPTLPIFTRDRLAYHALTLNSTNFHSIVQWSQQINSTSALTFIKNLPQQQRNFLNHFANVHAKLMHLIGCNNQKGSLYRHIVEFHKPNFKLLVMMFPFEQLSMLPPLSRTSRLHWYPSKNLDHLHFLSQRVTNTPSCLTSKLWRQPRAVHHAQTSQLPRGLYLALFYCQSSPPNNQRGLQIFLEKHHEHRLPCVPIRHDTQISNVEWEWLQTLGRDSSSNTMDQDMDDDGDGGGADYYEKGGLNNASTALDIGGKGNGFSETYDFLTKEMQQRQQQQQLETQQRLAPFQQALRQGRRQLQELVGVPIDLKDLFSEDSLCLLYEDDDNNNTVNKDHDDVNTWHDTNSTMKTTLNDLDLDESDDYDDDSMTLPRKTLKKKTLSIADMFTYGQQQTQHGWTRPVHVRMLVIVKPLCVTPDFPVRPNFDFYPCKVFRTLHQDKLQFATSSLESPPPRRQPHHHLSMSDLLNNTIHVNSSLLSAKRPRSSWDLNDDGDQVNDGDHHGLSYLGTGDYTNRHIEKRRSFCTTTFMTTPSTISNQQHCFDSPGPTFQATSMAMFYQDKDMKGWTGRLLEFDRQRMVHQQQQQRLSPLLGNDSSLSYSTNDGMKTEDCPLPSHGTPRTSRIMSTCSLPINFNTTAHPSAHYHDHDPMSSTSVTLSKRLKRWWLARRRKI